jgi:hypothetical protein
VRTNLTAGMEERVYVPIVSVESRARVNSTESLETLPTAIAKLAAAGPASEFVEKLMVFGQFVGSWDVVNVNIDEQDGRRLDEHRCEWHFSWVLCGRGVQDVLYAVDWSPDRFGSTFRCYDPKADVWRCTWMIPAGDEFVNIVGREVDGRIELIGQGPDTDRIERWTFSDITNDFFFWQGEVSRDGGETWRLIKEMQAKRHGS